MAKHTKCSHRECRAGQPAAGEVYLQRAAGGGLEDRAGVVTVASLAERHTRRVGVSPRGES